MWFLKRADVLLIIGRHVNTLEKVIELTQSFLLHSNGIPVVFLTFATINPLVMPVKKLKVLPVKGCVGEIICSDKMFLEQVLRTSNNLKHK